MIHVRNIDLILITLVLGNIFAVGMLHQVDRLIPYKFVRIVGTVLFRNYLVYVVGARSRYNFCSVIDIIGKIKLVEYLSS